MYRRHHKSFVFERSMHASTGTLDTNVQLAGWLYRVPDINYILTYSVFTAHAPCLDGREESYFPCNVPGYNFLRGIDDHVLHRFPTD